LLPLSNRPQLTVEYFPSPSCAGPEDCFDSNPCTDEDCVSFVCEYTYNTGSCDDGSYCNGVDTCAGGVCNRSGDPCAGTGEVCKESVNSCLPCGIDADCDDGDACTTDVCNVSICEYTYNTSPCDDGSFCNGVDTCASGVCGHAGDPCAGAGDVCDETTDVCVDCLVDDHCDDSDPCTADACISGVCVNTRRLNCCTDLTPLVVSQTTADKPQSKVWFHAGSWWAVLPTSSGVAGTWLWELQDDAWSEALQLSGSTSARADVKSVGDVAHVLLFDGVGSELVSVEHNGTTYQLWSARPTPAPITLDVDVETATIDIDSTGRMWLASDGSSEINVRYSDAPYATWNGSPDVTLASAVASDDIGAVIALPDQTVGVLWSNQLTRRFGFRLHADGDPVGTWSADEVPASQSAQSQGAGMADDHLNLAALSDGTLFAAVKTGYNTSGYPQMALLVRRPDGTWDDLYEVDEAGTRPIVLLDETGGRLIYVYAATEGLTNMVYRTSSLEDVGIGDLTTLSSSLLNDATSTKQNFTGEVVILGSDGQYVEGVRCGEFGTIGTLVGYWKMEEGGGTTLVDASGNGNHAGLSGSPTWPEGVDGLALGLDGTTDYGTVPDDDSLDATDGITLALAVKPERTGTQDLLTKAATDTTDGYSLSLASSGVPFVRFNQASSGEALRLNATTPYPVDGNTWIHLAATYDGTDIRIYVDGAEEAVSPQTFVISANALELGIGAQSDGTRHFQGAVDDVRVYSRALSGPEIAELATVIWDCAVPTDCDDDNPCTDDDCVSGSCVNDPTVAGTPCGDQGVECLVDDTCDGSGECADSGPAPAGTACGDQGIECLVDDTCDGTGVCMDNGFSPAGTACGDQGIQCFIDDTCDGGGQCMDNGFVPDGTACNDGVSCTDPDQCSSGLCLGVDACPEGEICEPVLDTCIAAAVASLPADRTVCPGTSGYVSVDVTPVDGAVALDLAFAYDPAILRATGVLKTPLTESFTLASDLSTPGVVDIMLDGTPALAGAGDVAWVAFDPVGSPGEISLLSWTHAEINGGGIHVTPQDGSITLDAAQTSLSLPDIASGSGTNVVVPLAATPAAGTSTELMVAYDWTVIQVVDVTTTPISAGHTLVYDDAVPGQLSISLSGASPLTGSGAIVNIEFFVVGSTAERSPMILAGAMIDAGAIATCLDDGTLFVCDSLVGEVQGLIIDAGSTLTWVDQGGGAHYDLVSGSISDLTADGGVASATCLQDNVAGNSYTDSQPDPAPDSGYYYLIRAQNTCVTSTYGYATPGPERLPAGDCP
jgi:hypothetical protein